MDSAVIVLGAAQFDGKPSRTLAARVAQAAQLYRKHPGVDIFTVGGGQPGDRFTEAEVARDLLIESGVPGHMITSIACGYDTASSLAAVLRVRAMDRAVIVTDAIHGPRTFLIARTLGIKARIVAAAHSPTRFPRATWWRSLAHEVGGIIYLFCARYLPRPVARWVRTGLYAVEGIIRPTWRGRHQQIRSKR